MADKSNWLVTVPVQECEKVSNAGGGNSNATSLHCEVAAERLHSAERTYTLALFCGSHWSLRDGEKTFLNLTGGNDETKYENALSCQFR